MMDYLYFIDFIGYFFVNFIKARRFVFSVGGGGVELGRVVFYV